MIENKEKKRKMSHTVVRLHKCACSQSLQLIDRNGFATEKSLRIVWLGYKLFRITIIGIIYFKIIILYLMWDKNNICYSEIANFKVSNFVILF